MQQARKLNYTDQKRLPQEPIVKPLSRPRPGRGLAKFKLLSIFLICFILSLIVVAQYSSLVILNYRISNIRSEMMALSEVTRELELEAAQLSTASRIEQIAREELGMIEPQISQMIVLSARQGEGSFSGE